MLDMELQDLGFTLLWFGLALILFFFTTYLFLPFNTGMFTLPCILRPRYLFPDGMDSHS